MQSDYSVDPIQKEIDDEIKREEIKSLKRLETAEKLLNPADVSATIRLRCIEKEKEHKERIQKRLDEYNAKPNNVIESELLNVSSDGKEQQIHWNSEKLIDSTIRELLAIKMNLMKESIESLGIEFQETTQYNTNFIKYDNWMLPGMFEGDPSHETVDTAIALTCMFTINGDFPIPPLVLEYIKEMITGGYIYEKRISMALNSEELWERGKTLVQTMVDAGISNYVALGIAGALFVESGWNAVKCPEQTEFGGLISQKRYQLNGNGHNWGDAGEGLFGLTFWAAKERIIKDPEFGPLKDKYGIPDTFQKYNEDLAAGAVDTMYTTTWKGSTVTASGHLSNLELDEWGIPLKLFLKGSRYWGDVFENTPEHEEKIAAMDLDYLTACLAASYLFKAGGKEPTFAEAKSRSSIYRTQHQSMGYTHIQDGWATQMIISIALSKFIKGEPVEGGYEELKQIILSM
jgi:hypothetical protein